jgi:predicted metal-binding membrane protein
LTAAALTATLGLAAASSIVAVHQMDEMDMGVATKLGSFPFFVTAWVSMMAAMMLPGAAPAALGRIRASERAFAVLSFVGSYLAVWILVGLAVYALYRPHGTAVAGALTIVADSTSSHRSSGTSGGAAAKTSALECGSGSLAPARASD